MTKVIAAVLLLPFFLACNSEGQGTGISLPEKQGEIEKIKQFLQFTIPAKSELVYYFRASEKDRERGSEEWLFLCNCEFSFSPIKNSKCSWSDSNLTEGLERMVQHRYKKGRVEKGTNSELGRCIINPYFYEVNLLQTAERNYLLISKRARDK